MLRLFEPHVHMTSRTTDDYAAMAAAGVVALVEPAGWLGQPRTSVDTVVDYFDALLGWEPVRAAEFGIGHHAALALNPKEANDSRLGGVLDLLPRYLRDHRVVAIGEIGYDALTPAEDLAFVTQLAFAVEYGLPVLVHTPHRDKLVGTRRALDALRESGLEPDRVVVDHLDESTVDVVADGGCWMGFSLGPDTGVSVARMIALLGRYGTGRMLVNSAAGWGRGDPLATRAVAVAMLAAGFRDADVETVCWRNPVAFYGRSGRLALARPDGPPRPGGVAGHG